MAGYGVEDGHVDSSGSMRTKVTAFLLPLLLVALLTTFCGLGYVLARVLGLPMRLGLPPLFRFGGVLVLVIGFSLLIWIFKHRRPTDVVLSTYISFVKVLRRANPQEPSGRAEPLVITGPHRCVRHPMYFAVILLVAGWWLVLDYTFLLFLPVCLFLWFNFVVIPFEERELRALFGEEYEAYTRRTPRLFPFLLRGRGQRNAS
jgi:steroid 5-alpha reductase family enzyme